MTQRSHSRRALFQGAGATLGLSWLGALLPAAEVKTAAFMAERRSETLRYVEGMRFLDGPYGRYRYSAEMAQPTLYSSTYAAMTRSLYRDLDGLTPVQRQEWIAGLQAHQDDDGLFRDPLIFGQGWYKDDPEWCGRRHLTCHVVTALTCLGAVAAKPLVCLEPFYDLETITTTDTAAHFTTFPTTNITTLASTKFAANDASFHTTNITS